MFCFDQLFDWKGGRSHQMRSGHLEGIKFYRLSPVVVSPIPDTEPISGAGVTNHCAGDCEVANAEDLLEFVQGEFVFCGQGEMMFPLTRYCFPTSETASLVLAQLTES